MLVNDRRLRACTAEGGAWGEDKLEVLVRFLVSENPFGDLEQSPEFDQGGHAGSDRRLESLFADPAESECPKSGLVGDAKQIIALCKRVDGAPLALGEAAFGALHQAPSPGVGGRVADRAEGGLAWWRRKTAAR